MPSYSSSYCYSTSCQVTSRQASTPRRRRTTMTSSFGFDSSRYSSTLTLTLLALLTQHIILCAATATEKTTTAKTTTGATTATTTLATLSSTAMVEPASSTGPSTSSAGPAPPPSGPTSPSGPTISPTGPPTSSIGTTVPVTVETAIEIEVNNYPEIQKLFMKSRDAFWRDCHSSPAGKSLAIPASTEFLSATGPTAPRVGKARLIRRGGAVRIRRASAPAAPAPAAPAEGPAAAADANYVPVASGLLSATIAYARGPKDNVWITCTPGIPGTPIDWYHGGVKLATDGIQYVIYPNGTLLVINIAEADVGPYDCIEATGLQRKDTAFIYCPPVVTQPLSLFGYQGQSLELGCEAYAYPPPTVTWLANGLPYHPDEPRVAIEDFHSKTGIPVYHGSIIFHSIQQSDYLNYTCVVAGLNKTTKGSTLVRVRDKLAPLWPFIGVIGELGIIGGVIGAYEVRKNRLKREEKHEDEEYNKYNTVEYRRAQELQQRQEGHLGQHIQHDLVAHDHESHF